MILHDDNDDVVRFISLFALLISIFVETVRMMCWNDIIWVRG